jgi:nucleotide-binding universal stress UspA family protein
MTTTDPKRPLTVIVGVDYSDTSALALVEAVRAARSRDDNHVHVVHVMSPVQTVGPMAGAYVPPVLDTAKASDELKQFVEKTLAEAQKGLPDDGRPIVDRLTTHLGMSDPREAIAQLASDLDADLVVIGTHGRRGVSRFLLGSVAEGVVRIAPCPVLVVRPRGTAASKVPEIEPPCPQCVETRRASEGKDFWCAQHREHHDRRHTYHFGPVRAGHQSGLLIPLFR